MKLAYLITHPQFGIQVTANPGETPTQALSRYNMTILGWDPSDLPAEHPLNPRWTQIYSLGQLQSFVGIVASLGDPDTREPLTVEQYIENLPRYTEERQSPLPAETWQA